MNIAYLLTYSNLNISPDFLFLIFNALKKIVALNPNIDVITFLTTIIK